MITCIGIVAILLGLFIYRLGNYWNPFADPDKFSIIGSILIYIGIIALAIPVCILAWRHLP